MGRMHWTALSSPNNYLKRTTVADRQQTAAVKQPQCDPHKMYNETTYSKGSE